MTRMTQLLLGRIRTSSDRNGPKRWSRSKLSAPVDHNQVGGDANEKASREQPQPHLPVSIPAHPVPDLADDVENGPARQAVEGELERLRGDVVADDRAQEHRSPADQPGKSQPAPGRADRAKWADDAEP